MHHLLRARSGHGHLHMWPHVRLLCLRSAPQEGPARLLPHLPPPHQGHHQDLPKLLARRGAPPRTPTSSGSGLAPAKGHTNAAPSPFPHFGNSSSLSIKPEAPEGSGSKGVLCREVGPEAERPAEGREGVRTLSTSPSAPSSSLRAEGLHWGLRLSQSLPTWDRLLGGPSSPCGTFVRIRKCVPSSGQMWP